MIDCLKKIFNKPPHNEPIFIGGEGRSGTTLMRVILDTHSNIACGPETQLFRDEKVFELYHYLLDTYKGRISEYSAGPDRYLANAFVAMYNKFLGDYAKKKGKTRWAEKSPHNIMVIDELVNLFDGKIKFIHMIRDGRDVATSMLTMDWGPNTIEAAASRWQDCIKQGTQHRGKDYYMEIKYEDLINDLEAILKKVFDFLGERYTDDLLDFNQSSHDFGNESSTDQVKKPLYITSIGRYKNELSIEQIKKFEVIAKDTLLDLGYDV